MIDRCWPRAGSAGALVSAANPTEGRGSGLFDEPDIRKQKKIKKIKKNPKKCRRAAEKNDRK
jgi:hypothetical protein